MHFKIQTINRHRLTTDGAGITTLIGLAGCPLSCRYCINRYVLKHSPCREYTQEQLLNSIMQDYCYFVASEGGITFGGGEPLLQSQAIQEFFDRLPQAVSVNLETSLYAQEELLLPLLEPVREFIIDIKSLNPEIYQTYTGLALEPVWKNLNRIAQNGVQGKCRLRIPRIPGLTTEADIQASVSRLRELGFSNLQVFDYIIPTE